MRGEPDLVVAQVLGESTVDGRPPKRTAGVAHPVTAHEDEPRLRFVATTSEIGRGRVAWRGELEPSHLCARLARVDDERDGAA